MIAVQCKEYKMISMQSVSKIHNSLEFDFIFSHVKIKHITLKYWLKNLLRYQRNIENFCNTLIISAVRNDEKVCSKYDSVVKIKSYRILIFQLLCMYIPIYSLKLSIPAKRKSKTISIAKLPAGYGNNSACNKKQTLELSWFCYSCECTTWKCLDVS